MMETLTVLVCGGVLERFPRLQLIFLEANGGWIVPWLERLDHHYEVFSWDVPWLKMKPSEYFRRQCWISFDPDESTIAFTARSPLVGADRIIWASDYPHPDAKIPGVVKELREATEALDAAARARVLGLNAAELYRLPTPA
jgi:predicted TIM-barrel fold metal-dependent hydrolase